MQDLSPTVGALEVISLITTAASPKIELVL